MEIKKHIVIVGIMGAGKSSFGTRIANKLRCSFFDLDKEIKNKTGYSSKEMFNEFGHETLKNTESTLLKEIILKQQPAIIATGDYTIENEENWEFIKAHTTTVWLNISLKTIAQRLKPNDNRPHLKEDTDVLKAISRLYFKRKNRYKECDITLFKPILNKDVFLKKILKLQEGAVNKKLIKQQ